MSSDVADLLANARVIHLQPDDQIVIHMDRPLTPELAERIRDTFDGRQVVVLDQGITIGIAADRAITALRRITDVVTQIDEHADTMDNTAEAWKRLDNQPDWARCAAVADALREHTDRLRAVLAEANR